MQYNRIDNVEGGEKFSFEQRSAHIKAFTSEAVKQGVKPSVQRNLVTKELDGMSYDIAKDLEQITRTIDNLRMGSTTRAAADITLAEFMEEAYGIPMGKNGTCDNVLSVLGINKNEQSIGYFLDYSKGAMSFTTIPELNKNFKWLIGETVTEAVRSTLQQRAIYRRLVNKMETVPFDSIKVPVFKNPNGIFQELREGETVKMGTMEFDEIAMETKDIGCAFKLTDRAARNLKINIVQAQIAGSVGVNLDIQLTNEAVDRLINGNNAASLDAAPVIGVTTPGSFDYDNDWLELVIGMSELGYSPNVVLGVRQMVKEVYALPEFKGFDGVATKANLGGILMPADYFVQATGAMPAASPSGGQLLFVDPRFAMAHYTTKPLMMENVRNIESLTEKFVVSSTSCFVKELADAAMILDSTVNVSANPFPAEYDREAYERALGGFTRGL